MGIYSGSANNDTLTGSTSGDTYRYDFGSGNDIIADLGGTGDVLMFTNSRNIDVHFDIYRSGTANLVFDFGSAGRVTLQDQYAAAGTKRIESVNLDGILFTISAGVNSTVGNDLIVGTAVAETISGGNGHDVIFGGAGNDTLNGDAGNDTLTGDAGNDLLQGGADNDTYRFDLGMGNDTVSDAAGLSDTVAVDDPNGNYTSLDVFRSGTNGVDLVFNFGGAGALTIRNQYLAGATARIENLATPDSEFVIAQGLAGTGNNDFIVGTAGHDSIAGAGGDDWILAGAGNDTVFGNDGNNELHGGAGNDSLVAGSWGDDLYGGAGSDTLEGGAGRDSAYYEDQTAGVFANFSGGSEAWNNVVVGANQVLEFAGNTVDTLRSIEEFNGTAYADCIVLGRSDGGLSFTLGKGNDTVIGGAPNNVNNAWASLGYWDDPSGVIVNLSNRMVSATLGGVTYNVGRNSARDGWGNTDTFILDDGNLSINGSDSADFIRGRDNNQVWEFFDGGRGNDTIDGGGNVDLVNYDRTGDDPGSMGAVVNLSATAYSGTLGGVTVNLAAGSARDTWGGTDTLRNIENANGSFMDDILVGSAGDNYFEGRNGNDLMLGGAGNDNLNGGSGNDTLNGGEGNDNLLGGEGNDTLFGGAGQDYFNGGGGSDVFVFNTALSAQTNVDQISDFTAGERIFLENGVLTGLGSVNNVALAANAFHAGAGAMAATTQAQRIIYNSANGDLYYDQDGVGGVAAVKFAVVGTGTGPAALSAGNFFVI